MIRGSGKESRMVRFNRVRAAALLALVLGAGSCGKTTEVDPSAVEFAVDSAGGVASHPGGAMVFVPAGAIEPGKRVVIRIAPDTQQPALADATVVGQSWVLGPAGT